MKVKFLFPAFFILLVVAVWTFNFFEYGGFSAYEKSVSKASNYYAQGKIQEAKLEAFKAVELKPDSAESRLLLAKIHLSSDEIPEAKEEYRRSLSIKPENPEAVKDLISVYNESQEYSKINELLEGYTDLNFLSKHIPKPPVSSKASGEYSNPISIALKNDLDDAKILYTTDDSDPTFTSQEYTEPITIDKGKHIIKARTNNNGLLSEVTVFKYEVENDFEVVKFINEEIENSLRNYFDKGSDSITSADIDKVDSIIIFGTKIYFGVTNSYPTFAEVDGQYLFSSIMVEREGSQIEYTIIPDGDFGSLSDLEYFTKVKSLYIYSQDNLDLIFLTKMNLLEKLTISNNISTKNLNVINSLKNLSELNIVHNNLLEVSILEGLKNLKNLDISFNRIEDINELAKLEKLEKLNITSNEIKDISPVFDVVTLRELDFDSNNVSSIEGIEKLEHLEKVNFYNNDVSDIFVLNKCKNLKYVDFDKNPAKGKFVFESGHVEKIQ